MSGENYMGRNVEEGKGYDFEDGTRVRTFTTEEIRNGRRKPVETYRFCQAMRHWRERSMDSHRRFD